MGGWGRPPSVNKQSWQNNLISMSLLGANNTKGYFHDIGLSLVQQRNVMLLVFDVNSFSLSVSRQSAAGLSFLWLSPHQAPATTGPSPPPDPTGLLTSFLLLKGIPDLDLCLHLHCCTP